MTKMTPYEQQQLKYNEVMNYINENFTKLQLQKIEGQAMA